MAFFFWGIIAIVFCVIWLGMLLVFISSRFYGSKLVRWVGFLSLLGTTACALWFIYNCFAPPTSTHVFEESFGFAPTNDVCELESKDKYSDGNERTYLKFKANSQTIKRIVALGLVEKSASQPENYVSTGTEVPPWWSTNLKTATRIYIKTNRFQRFTYEEEILCYDERTQQAYYSFQGID